MSNTIKGFTFIEILLALGILSIIGSIALLQFNPQKQFERMRNMQREQDTANILSEIYQYSLQHGHIPDVLPAEATEICALNAPDCTGYIDLSFLMRNETDITRIPKDPLIEHGNGTGYSIMIDEEQLITVSSLLTEGDSLITITR